MKTLDVSIARIYLNEGENQLDTLIKRLHDWEKLRGVTVFRGITGFGPSGEMHTSKLVDLSLHLPVVIEFFDEPDKVDAVIEHLSTYIQPGHIVRWPAQVIVD